jgi:electron transfer flavoprotein alpha subunit
MTVSIYNPGEERKSILVYLEHEGGVLANVSLELLGQGREMADQLHWSLAGLLMGHRVADLAHEAIAYGVDEVWLGEHPLLQFFTIEAYAHTAFQAVSDGKPSVFLLGATPNGRDLAGRLAVRLRTGLNADCAGLWIDPDSGVLVSEVSGFGGGVLALIEMRTHRPQMATVRPGVFTPLEMDRNRNGKVIEIPLVLEDDMIRTHVVEREVGSGIDLTRTPVIVAGGRGIEGDFLMLQKLADLLGGDIGATRPPVDEGHIERQRQIGQTGVVCSPEVAICCGISGAFHFVVGIEKANTVIAINSDPEAPIFDYADYCIVGDVHQIIPEIITALESKGEIAHA